MTTGSPLAMAFPASSSTASSNVAAWGFIRLTDLSRYCFGTGGTNMAERSSLRPDQSFLSLPGDRSDNNFVDRPHSEARQSLAYRAREELEVGHHLIRVAVNLARRSSRSVAMPVGHVLRWHWRAMSQPRATRTEVPNPNSSAPEHCGDDDVFSRLDPAISPQPYA